MKLVIFIHTCKKYEEGRSKLLENTWADHEDIVFITDNENSELKNHIYIGPYIVGKTYHPENVKKMFEIFSNKYSEYDFFMIVDDDSYVNVDKLKLFLSFFNKEDSYMIGDYLNWPSYKDVTQIWENYNFWAGGGPGIVFTKSCITNFIELYSNNNVELTNHDVWLHELYKVSQGKGLIKRVHCPGFHQYRSDNLYTKFSKEDNCIVSIHFNGDMTLLSKYYTS